MIVYHILYSYQNIVCVVFVCGGVHGCVHVYIHCEKDAICIGKMNAYKED